MKYWNITETVRSSVNKIKFKFIRSKFAPKSAKKLVNETRENITYRQEVKFWRSSTTKKDFLYTKFLKKTKFVLKMSGVTFEKFEISFFEELTAQKYSLREHISDQEYEKMQLFQLWI